MTILLIFKGAGVLRQDPPVFSPDGLLIGIGAVVALLAVVLAGSAGYGREQARSGARGGGNFYVSLLLALLAGVHSCCYTLSFVYYHGPITLALKAEGAGDVVATFAVWALALADGALVSVGYAAWLLVRNRSWGVLLESPKEFCLALLIGLNIAVSIVFLGSGMLLMGALGGSVGTGLQQVVWMLGGQGAGFISGEWHGVAGRPRNRILLPRGLLLLAALLLASGNFFAQSGVAPLP